MIANLYKEKTPKSTLLVVDKWTIKVAFAPWLEKSQMTHKPYSYGLLVMP